MDRGHKKDKRGPGDRPTEKPPFDPEVYARESERLMKVEPQHHTEPPPTKPRGHSIISEVRMAQASRPMLEAQPDLVPLIAVSREDLEWFDLDDDARKILSHIDGASMLGEVLAHASDVPDAITVFGELIRLGIVQFRRWDGAAK